MSEWDEMPDKKPSKIYIAAVVGLFLIALWMGGHAAYNAGYFVGNN